MQTYIGLLRGINVSGQKKIKMADLKIMFEDLGFTSVITYIQSGNVFFKSEEKELEVIEDVIKKGIANTFGYDVPVLILTSETIQTIYKENPYLDRINNGEIEDKKMYFTLFSTSPDQEKIDVLQQQSYGEEEFIITSKVVYFFAANGYGKTKLTNNFFEKKLGVNATTRNLKTMVALLKIFAVN